MTAPDLIDMFDRTLTHTSGVVEAVDPSQAALPTPCDAWSVQDLVHHMVGTLRASVDFLEGRTPDYDPSKPVDTGTTDLAAAFRAAADASLAAHRAPGALDRMIDSPAGRMPGGAFLNFPLMDMWVHSWDLAQATGQRPTFADDVTGYLLGFCHQAFGQNRPPEHVIGAEVPVADDAEAIDRLVGFLGRRPTPSPT